MGFFLLFCRNSFTSIVVSTLRIELLQLILIKPHIIVVETSRLYFLTMTRFQFGRRNTLIYWYFYFCWITNTFQNNDSNFQGKILLCISLIWDLNFQDIFLCWFSLVYFISMIWSFFCYRNLILIRQVNDTTVLIKF